MLHKTCKKLSRAINSLISEKHLIKWREACKLCEAIATVQYLCVRICICVYVCKWCLLILETPKSSVSSRKTWTSVGFSRLTWPKLDIFQWKVMIFKNLFRAGSMLNVRDVYKRQNYSLTHWLIRRPSKHKKKKTKLPMEKRRFCTLTWMCPLCMSHANLLIPKRGKSSGHIGKRIDMWKIQLFDLLPWGRKEIII